MSDSIKRLKELNAENQRVVRVNVGVLRAAITEISVHVAANRKGIMTDMVLNGLKAAIGEPIAVAGEVGKAHPAPVPAVPEKIPDSVYQLIYQECGGFVDCDADPQKIWEACRAAVVDRHVRDLTMMVKLLARTVRKYNPESQQAKDFMAYLQREGLTSTSDILRDGAKDPE